MDEEDTRPAYQREFGGSPARIESTTKTQDFKLPPWEGTMEVTQGPRYVKDEPTDPDGVDLITINMRHTVYGDTVALVFNTEHSVRTQRVTAMLDKLVALIAAEDTAFAVRGFEDGASDE